MGCVVPVALSRLPPASKYSLSSPDILKTGRLGSSDRVHAVLWAKGHEGVLIARDVYMDTCARQARFRMRHLPSDDPSVDSFHVVVSFLCLRVVPPRRGLKLGLRRGAKNAEWIFPPPQAPLGYIPLLCHAPFLSLWLNNTRLTSPGAPASEG